MTVDDALLLAYVDGELDPARRSEVEAAIAADPGLAERARAHGEVRAALSETFGPVLEEPVPIHLIRAAQRPDSRPAVARP